MEFDKSVHLDSVLETHKMKHVSAFMDNCIKKKTKVKDALEEKYKDKIAIRAIDSGSYAKHTAINRKFDVDICQPYKYGSFDSLQKMADDLYDYFQNEFVDEDFVKYKTRKQRVSVGLTFVVDGEEIQMDVVPGRELLVDNYTVTNRLNLYVRKKGSDPATSTQTNIQKHVDHINGKHDERKIIRLLKVWKFNKGKSVKSFFIELIIIRAFDNCNNVPTDIWGKLKMGLEFIRDKVETIRLEDPANSNNVVSDTLSSSEKKNLSDDMQLMLKNIEERGEDIKIYFPVNDKYSKAAAPTRLKTQSFG